MLAGGAAVLAAAAAGSEDAAGGEAGIGLGAGGTKGTSVLCSWLRWSPETLVELDVFDSRFSFEFRPLLSVGEKSFSDPTSDAQIPEQVSPKRHH